MEKGPADPVDPVDPNSYPVYSIGSNYIAGDIVIGKDNSLYQCKPWPYSGWCSNAAYAPAGTYSDQAWTKL